jgi:hypothetical protein
VRDEAVAEKTPRFIFFFLAGTFFRSSHNRQKQRLHKNQQQKKKEKEKPTQKNNGRCFGFDSAREPRHSAQLH